MLPFNGVAVPFGTVPVGVALTPPGGVAAPKAVAPGFGVAVGKAPPFKRVATGETVGFGRLAGVGFCWANLVLSSVSVFGSTPFHPLSTTGFAFLIVVTGSFVAVAFKVVAGPVIFSCPLLMLDPGVFPFWYTSETGLITVPVFCWTVATAGPKLLITVLLLVIFVTFTVFLINVTFWAGGKI
jgi:hypothetical protein